MRSHFLMMICCCTAALAAQEKPPLLGQVINEQGQPLANVAVCTFADGERWTTAELVQAAEVHTDPLGRFRLADASATRAPHWDRVLLAAPGRLSMVVRREQLDFAPIVLMPGAVLAGRVLDGSGNPIAGARVEASDYLREVAYLGTQPSDRRLEPAPVAAARTDARGTFVLSGACGTAAWLVADGDGFREAGLGPVSAHDPLSIVLEPAPMLRGRIVHPESGAVGDLLVQMVRRGESRWTRTDNAGVFTFTWQGGPVRLSLAAQQGDQRWIASASVEEPEAEAVLTLRLFPPRDTTPRRRNLARKVQPARVVSVRAIGPDGEPLTGFRASVHRIDRQQQDHRTEVRQLREFETAAATAVEGVAAASVFDGYGEDGLLVLVQAPGMALFCDVFDADRESVEVELEPAAVLAGKVVDARSGEPLAGVRVWSLAKSERFKPERLLFDRVADGDPEFGVATTDATGAFRLGQVAAGSRHLFCTLPGRAERLPELIEVVSGSSRLDLRLELVALMDIDGQVAGRLPPRTLGVRLKKHTPGAWTSTEAADYSSLFPVDAKGRFRATGIAPDTYEAQLVVMRLPRQGLPDKLLLEVLEVGLETKTLELDATPMHPARVTGRVTGSVPASRLAVVSSAAPTGNSFFGYLHYEGPIVPVEPDGSFALEEPPGARILVVIDLWTGAMLHREPEVQVAPGSERKVELVVDALAVNFQLTGASTGWHWLEIVPSPEHWPGGVGQIAKFQDHGYFLHMGPRLEPGRTDGVLYLPAAPCELRLRAAEGRDRKPRDKDVLVRQAVDPSQVKDRDVTIAVSPK